MPKPPNISKRLKDMELPDCLFAKGSKSLNNRKL